MRFRLLRHFVTIAELGSLTRASEKLFISQPPLSAQLKQLEQQVGAALFIRQPRGMVLTPAGESLYQDAKEILARLDHAVERAREHQSGRKSTLRVGMVPSATYSILPVMLKRVAENQLNIQLQVSNLITSQQLRALRNDEIDVGFARVNDADIPPEAVAVLDDPYCLAISSSNHLAGEEGPVALGEASAERFIGFATHHQTAYRDRTLALCAEAGFDPNIQHVGGGWSSMLAMVGMGLGIGIVPASFATLPSTNVTFRRIVSSRYHGRFVVLGSPRLAGTLWSESVLTTAVEALQVLANKLVPYGSKGVISGACLKPPIRRSPPGAMT